MKLELLFFVSVKIISWCALLHPLPFLHWVTSCIFLQQACEWALNSLRRKMLKYTVTLNNHIWLIIPKNHSFKSWRFIQLVIQPYFMYKVNHMWYLNIWITITWVVCALFPFPILIWNFQYECRSFDIIQVVNILEPLFQGLLYKMHNFSCDVFTLEILKYIWAMVFRFCIGILIYYIAQNEYILIRHILPSHMYTVYIVINKQNALYTCFTKRGVTSESSCIYSKTFIKCTVLLSLHFSFVFINIILRPVLAMQSYSMCLNSLCNQQCPLGEILG